MRTTLVLDEKLIEEVKSVAGVRTKREAVETADLLIASAAHGRAVLIHRDGDFKRIAETAGLKEEMI